MLTLENLTIRVAGRVLFEQASATLPSRGRVGLVGRNGCGKSTLLKAIAGNLSADVGEIGWPAGWSLGQTTQEAPDSDDSLLDTVLSADKERTALLAESEQVTDPDRLSDIYDRLTEIDAYTAPSRAARILAGLGFDEEAQQRPCSSFSGGWRMRVALASLLFTTPDLLLLDEPTNHLDLEATLWLEDYLKAYPGTIVIVSHDRRLLNAVPQHIWHINNGRLKAWQGNYDTFRRTRAERIALDEKGAKKQAVRKAHLQSFVDRFRYKASKATQAQSRIKMIEKMQDIVVETDEAVAPLRFKDPDGLSPPLVRIERADVGYGGPPVLSGLNLRLDPEDRVALLGANGNGKSTLIKLIADRLKADAGGEVFRAAKLRIGYFAQHQADDLPLDQTPLEALRALRPGFTPQKIRNLLGSFGLTDMRAETKIEQLSGGEKARLLFCILSLEEPHILLLDEPTNHLDIETREALVESLAAFGGAVVLVSHDPDLVTMVAEQLWLVADGTVTTFDDDIEGYKRLLTGERKPGKDKPANGPGPVADKVAPAKAAAPEPAVSSKEQRQAKADQRKALAPLKKTADKAEKALQQLEAKRAKLETDMASPDYFASKSSADIAGAQQELGRLVKSISEAEEAWMNAQEIYEDALEASL